MTAPNIAYLMIGFGVGVALAALFYWQLWRQQMDSRNIQVNRLLNQIGCLTRERDDLQRAVIARHVRGCNCRGKGGE